MTDTGKRAWFALMIRRARRYGAGLPCEPGRRSREDVALQAQLLVLAPEAHEFVALGGRQDIVSGGRLRLAATFPSIGLGNPISDGLAGRLELASKVGGITTGANQVDDLLPELRRVSWTGFGHRRTCTGPGS